MIVLRYGWRDLAATALLRSRPDGAEAENIACWFWFGVVRRLGFQKKRGASVYICSGQRRPATRRVTGLRWLEQIETRTPTYGEVVRQVTLKTFRRWENDLPWNVTKTMWLTTRFELFLCHSAAFCAILYLNEASYMPENTTPNSEGYQNRRQNNFNFLQIEPSSSPTEFSSFMILSNKVFRNSSLEKELLVHYGNKYDFSYRRWSQEKRTSPWAVFRDWRGKSKLPPSQLSTISLKRCKTHLMRRSDVFLLHERDNSVSSVNR